MGGSDHGRQPACIYLILDVMDGSLAVLFHSDIMSSVGRMEMTTPHISSPTMNCSPRMANSWDEWKIDMYM